MIRPFRKSDQSRLWELFKLNTPDYFALSELQDLQEYLKLHFRTYYVIESESNLQSSMINFQHLVFSDLPDIDIPELHQTGRAYPLSIFLASVVLKSDRAGFR